MAEYKTLVVDACIPIAKFRGADPPFQQSHTDIFCSLVEDHPLKIEIIESVLEEVSRKYGYLMPSVNEFLEKLRSAGKFELIKKSAFAGHTAQIHSAREDAKAKGFNLSFTDALQVHYAKISKCPLISWDRAVIDYCELEGITAFRPNEFCEHYERNYCQAK